MSTLQPATFVIAVIFQGLLFSPVQAEEVPATIYKEIQRLAELNSVKIERPTPEQIESKQLGSKVAFRGTAENVPRIVGFKASLEKSKKLKGFAIEFGLPSIKDGAARFEFVIKAVDNDVKQ